jgi:hypothetical protein
MSTEKPDAGVVKSFRFDRYTAEQIQRWIDLGYFESDADFEYNAHKIIFKVMEIIEQDKKVVDFNAVIIGIEIDVPILKEKHSLQ